MLKHLRSQENRREWYMVVGLLWATLTFTHWLWGWPLGIQATTQANAPTGGSVVGQIPWRHLLEGLPLVALGILYYLGRRHGNKTLTHPAPKLEIVGIRNNAHVAHEQVIYGTAPAGIPIELRVYVGGTWHVQGKADTFGDTWECTCWFGHSDSPAGSRYQLVALSSKDALPDKLTELPADALKSEIISVVRSTQAIIIHPAPVHNGQLLIHSAKWAPKGVSDGDVTKRVRSLVNNDRLDIAVGVDTFGHTYPEQGKYFTVAYSVIKTLEVAEWPKPARFVLPQPEYSPVPTIAASPIEESKPLRTGNELRAYNALLDEFQRLPWQEQLVLYVIYQNPPKIHHLDLVRKLQNYGYGKDVLEVVNPAAQRTSFVKQDAASDIEPHPRNYKIVEDLLSDWKRYALS